MTDQERKRQRLPLTRRQFIKGTALAGTGAALAKAGVFDLNTAHAQGAGTTHFLPGPTADYQVPTLCEMCVWRCGVIASGASPASVPAGMTAPAAGAVPVLLNMP